MVLWYQIFVLLYLAGDAITIFSRDMLTEQIGIAVLYSGSLPAAAACWLLAVRYAEVQGHPFGWARGPWIHIPLVAMGVAWLGMITNPWHGQFLTPVIGAHNHHHWLWYSLVSIGYILITGSVVLYGALAVRARDRNVRSNALIMGGGLLLRTGAVHASADDLSDAHGTPDPAPGDYVFVEVSDSGPGIDDAARSRIFEPFFTTKFTGRGLGLAAVHGIVHAHRGAIKLDSRLGEGTAFRVLFPQSGRRTEPPLREPAPDGAAVSSTTRAATTVLVVDDDEAVLELAGTFLARADFRVLTARGGVEALRIFEERGRGIDVVVLDLSMPDLDGPETFKELRRRHSNVPIILTSGYSEEWAAKAAPAEQVAAFLGKPYEPEELIEQVRLAVSR